MKKLLVPALAGIVALSSCKKEADLDREVRLEFQFPNAYGIANPDYFSLPASTYLIDFDKRDYPKVDSITFNATLATNTSSDTAFVRLFNVTDGVVIENSILSATTKNLQEASQVHTNNISRSLPDKKITLAIQGRGVRSGGILSAFLKLRRN